jgi:hypothetical protein
MSNHHAERPSCGCTAQYPVCEQGRSLWKALSIWDQVVSDPAFLSWPVDLRYEVLDRYRIRANAYLSHCGCPVQEVSSE